LHSNLRENELYELYWQKSTVCYTGLKCTQYSEQGEAPLALHPSQPKIVKSY